MPNGPLILRALTAVQGLTLYVDGYTNRSHELTSRVGGEPIEDGRDVTDHVVAAPGLILLTGIASDLKGGERPTAAWQAVKQLHKNAEPVRIVTEWETLDEVVILRAKGTAVGRGLRFELELQEILRVEGASIIDIATPIVPPAAQSGPASLRSSEVRRGLVNLAETSGGEAEASLVEEYDRRRRAQEEAGRAAARRAEERGDPLRDEFN